MVQLKYFGDSRDYFKYDLITSIFKKRLVDGYVFIPMLTEPRSGNYEGNKKPVCQGDKSYELLKFIDACENNSLEHWKTWLEHHSNISYYDTKDPADEIFFCHDSRSEYWGKFIPLMKRDEALVFVDPDTGLETGSESYRKRQGPEKYILNGELEELFRNLGRESMLMIYQHLPFNKKTHSAGIKKKVTQVRRVCLSEYICAYREDDVAFVFIAESKEDFVTLLQFLHEYCENSKSQCKEVVLLPNDSI